MTTPLEPVRPVALSEIRDARKRIAGTVVRTPLVRLELGPGFPDVRLKLENLQPINAYKLRGAANAVALLSDAERGRGVWTISAGNAGQGVAYAARAAGVPCTVVAIETAPAAKLERMRALGAKLVLVPYGVAWQALDDRAYPGVSGTFIHPFDDQNFITGHATMGLEILEDAPDTVAMKSESHRPGPVEFLAGRMLLFEHAQQLDSLLQRVAQASDADDQLSQGREGKAVGQIDPHAVFVKADRRRRNAHAMLSKSGRGCP